MTVEQLIEKLKEFPKDLQVICDHSPFAYLKINEAKDGNGEVVLLEVESII